MPESRWWDGLLLLAEGPGSGDSSPSAASSTRSESEESASDPGEVGLLLIQAPPRLRLGSLEAGIEH